jgi:hypothetical protein
MASVCLSFCLYLRNAAFLLPSLSSNNKMDPEAKRRDEEGVMRGRWIGEEKIGREGLKDFFS